MTANFELSRKSIHLASLLVPFAAFYSLLATQLLIIAFILFYLYSEWRKIRQHSFFAHRLTVKVQREEELKGWALAPVFLGIGVLVAITFFRKEAYWIGIYQAGLSDTLAAFCGKKWGKARIPFFDRKTYVGSMAFFLSALPMTLFFLPPAEALVLCLLGAYLESLPFKDMDNLTVPIIITFLAEQFLIR